MSPASKLPFALLALSLAGSLAAQQPRFEQLELEDTEGDQRVLAEQFTTQTRAGLGGPWNVILRSPGMGNGVFALYNHYRWDTVLTPAIMEFGVLLVAREWDSQYEWYIHYPLAVSAGMPEAVLAELRDGKRPSGMEPLHDAVYEFATEMMRTHFVSQATFERAKEHLGEQGVVELTGLIGTYITLAGLLSVSEVGVPDSDGPGYLPVP